MDKPVPPEAKKAIQKFIEAKLREAHRTGEFHPCIPEYLKEAILHMREHRIPLKEPEPPQVPPDDAENEP